MSDINPPGGAAMVYAADVILRLAAAKDASRGNMTFIVSKNRFQRRMTSINRLQACQSDEFNIIIDTPKGKWVKMDVCWSNEAEPGSWVRRSKQPANELFTAAINALDGKKTKPDHSPEGMVISVTHDDECRRQFLIHWFK